MCVSSSPVPSCRAPLTLSGRLPRRECSSSLAALSKVVTAQSFTQNIRLVAVPALGKLLEADSALRREAAVVLGTAQCSQMGTRPLPIASSHLQCAGTRAADLMANNEDYQGAVAGLNIASKLVALIASDADTVPIGLREVRPGPHRDGTSLSAR